jgi:hypothetical protein
MSLIQRNVIPILVLLAVIGVGMTIFAVTSPFASGQETESCEPGVGISIATTNADGQTVAVANHGDDIFYSVRLFKDENLCDFGGGTLTITLPGPTGDYPDGTFEVDLTETDFEGNESNLIISLGNSYNSGQIQYTVNQDHGVQANADDQGSVELTVRANYMGGRSQDSAGTELPNEVDATATSIIRITPPSVGIAISPTTVEDPNDPDVQSVLQGQTAYFDVVITNTGGFELSNISVASLEDAEANEVRVEGCERAAAAFGPLAVGDSTSYQCDTTTGATIVQRVQVTAYGTALDTEGAAVQLEVINDDPTNVIYGEVDVNIGITPLQDPVRYNADPEAQEGGFTIVASTPEDSDLETVSITVTVTGPGGSAESADADDCHREFETVPAALSSKPAELQSAGYSCSAKMNEGLNTIVATIQGTIPGTTTVLTASADTVIEAISPGLTVELTPQDQTIRRGETAAITVTVTNGASELTGVSVVDPDPNNEDGLNLSSCTTGAANDAISLADIGDLVASQQIAIVCSSAALTEETGYEAVAIGTARDNTTEPSGVARAVVRILSPSTDVGVSLLDGGSSVVQLVVQTVVVTETNDGDSDLTGIYVDVSAAGIGPDLTSMRLDRNSPQFVGSFGEDANDDDILNPGETWEWRVVVVGVTGNVVLLEPGATSIDVTASGYGTDALGSEVNPDTDADEIETQSIPFSVN